MNANTTDRICLSCRNRVTTRASGISVALTRPSTDFHKSFYYHFLRKYQAKELDRPRLSASACFRACAVCVHVVRVTIVYSLIGFVSFLRKQRLTHSGIHTSARTRVNYSGSLLLLTILYYTLFSLHTLRLRTLNENKGNLMFIFLSLFSRTLFRFQGFFRSFSRSCSSFFLFLSLALCRSSRSNATVPQRLINICLPRAI